MRKSTIRTMRNGRQAVLFRRLVAAWLAVVIASTAVYGSSAVFAAELSGSSGATIVKVNGQQVKSWSREPFIENGTTFVPLREAGNALGGTVSWNQQTQTATILLNDDRITHQAGTATMSINGLSLEMPAASKTVKGSLMIPLRSMAVSLRASIAVAKLSGITNIDIVTDHATYVSKALASVDKYLVSQAYSGIALVAKDGMVELRKGYGLSGGGKLAGPEDKSRIASVTKTFTAASIMKLVEQGKAKLDDPISAYVSGIPRGDDITLHMLLSHTSGLPSEFTRKDGLTIEQTIAEIRTKKLEFEPGTAYRYSNNGYVLLAYVIEKLSGMSYGDYIKKTILDPAGMTNSGTATTATPTIQGYLQKNGQWVEAPYYASQSGTGTLYSTVDDLLKWDRLLVSGVLLKDATLEKMYQSYSDKNYGYGWMVKQSAEGKTVFHNGSGSGYSSGISRNLGNGIVVILLSNHAGIDSIAMLNKIQSLAAEAL